MNRIDATDVINDYVKITRITNKNIDDVVNEIKFVLKNSKEFIKNSDLSIDQIKEYIQQNQKSSEKFIKKTTDAIDDISDNIQETKNTMVDISTGIKDTTKKMVDNTKAMGIILSISQLNTINSMNRIKESMMSDVSYILGDNERMFSLSFGIVKSLFMDVKNTFSSKMINTIEDGNEIQKDIRDTLIEDHKLNKQEYLANERLKNREKKSGMGTFKKLAIIGAIGAIIGGTIKTYLLPFILIFEKISKGLSFLGITKKTTEIGVIKKGLDYAKNITNEIVMWFKDFKGKIIEKITTKIIHLFSGITKRFKVVEYWIGEGGVLSDTFTKISKTFVKFNDKMKLVKKGLVLLGGKIGVLTFFFDAIKVGFKWLGWPLQIIFSLIDFIKGFAKSKSKTIFGKIEDGMTEAIVSFFELPIRTMAWIVEKLSFGKIKDLGDDWVSLFRESIHNILMPFMWIKVWLWKTTGDLEPLFVKLKNIMTATKNVIITFIEDIKFFFANFNKLGSISEKMSKFVKIFTKVGKSGLKIFKILGNIFPEFVSKLFWPITLFFGVMDFFTGFSMSKETSIVGKVKDGLTQALSEIVKWPIKILGYIIDKLYTLFTGKESFGTGDKMFKFVKEGIRTILDFIMTPISNIFEIVKMFGNIITFDFDGAMQNLKNIFHNTFDKFKMIGDWILSLIPDSIKNTITNIFSPIISFFKNIGDFVGNIIKYVTEKLKKLPVIGKMFKSKIEKEDIEYKKLSEQRSKIKNEINKQKELLKSGDKRTWMGRKRESIIKQKQIELADVGNKMATLRRNRRRYLGIKQKRDDDYIMYETKDNDKYQKWLSKNVKTKGNNQSLVDRIKKDEGYRSDLYKDSRGFWTGGFGTLISKDRNISRDQAIKLAGEKFGYRPNLDAAAKKQIWEKQLNTSVMKSRMGIEKLADQKGVKLSSKQKDILTNMGYNMGVGGVGKFQKMWDALKRGDTELAAKEMKNSKWYNQVPNRASTLASEMKQTSKDVLRSETNVKRKEMESRLSLGEVINKSMEKVGKSVESKNTQPIIVNQGEKTTPPEPPEDIEAMSILWLNKSYGLG